MLATRMPHGGTAPAAQGNVSLADWLESLDAASHATGSHPDLWIGAAGSQLRSGLLGLVDAIEHHSAPATQNDWAVVSPAAFQQASRDALMKTGPLGGGSPSSQPGPGLVNTDNGLVRPPAYDDVSTSSSGATVTGTTSAATPAATLTGTSGGFQINLVWDSSVANAPAGFMNAIIAAANVIDAAISNPITINIAVGWGEIGGSTIVGSGIAEGGPTSGIWQSYATLVSELKAGASSATDTSVVASLATAQNPNGNGNVAVWSAQEKALGIIAGRSTGIDGEIGFSTDFPSTYWTAAAVHEITHAMGRTSGYSPYGILDLLRYSGVGQHVYAGGTKAYFSVDGGKTPLRYFATSSDYGDWGTAATDPLYNAADPNNAFVSSSASALTTADLATLDAIGFTLKGSTPTQPPVVKPDLEITAAMALKSVVRGTSLSVTFLLGDIGQGPAGASTVAYSIDSKPTATSRLGTNANAGLAVGSQVSITDTISTSGLSVGQHTLWILADSTGTVAESNELNNLLGITFTVTAPGTRGAAGSTYVFAPDFGHDTITGWKTGSTIDLTALASAGVHSMANITQSIVGGNDVITQGSNTITLVGVSSVLGASSFKFV